MMAARDLLTQAGSRWRLPLFLAMTLLLSPLATRAAETSPAKTSSAETSPAKTSPAGRSLKPVPLAVRAAGHDGFGRLVFAAPDGTAAVPINASQTDGSLVLRFARPVAFSAASLDQRLPDYLSKARLSPDGLTLTARLAHPVSLKTARDTANTLFIDLVDPPKAAGSAAKPAKAAEATPAPKPKPEPDAIAALPKLGGKPLPVILRTSEQKDGSRLVFAWPKAVPAALVQEDGKARLGFAHAARLDVKRANASLPAALRPLTLAADKRSVSFTLPPGSHASLSRLGPKLIVDVTNPPPAPPPPQPASPPVKPVTAPEAKPATVATGAAQRTPAGAEGGLPNAATTAAITAGLIASRADDKGSVDISTTPTETNIGGSFGGGSGLRLIWSLAGDGLTLRFEWQQPVSAAVFRRGNGVWIVFDQEADLDLSRFEAQNLPVVTSLDQVPVKGAAVFHLGVWAGFNPQVARAGNTWIVGLKSGPTHPESPVQPQLQDANDGTTMVLPVLDPSQPIELDDADTAEQLVVVPVPELGQGVETQVSIPDLRVLPSNQGLVLKPIADGLSVRSEAQDVVVSAPGGLLVSTEVDRRAVRPVAIGKHEALVDFVAWRGRHENGDDQYKLRQLLQRTIMDADQPSKTAARANLAKFYVGNGLGAEALGVLAAIEKDDPEAFDDPQLRAVRAVASELMNRPAGTVADLQDKIFDDVPDALIWRAAAAADQQKWDVAVTGYEQGAERLDDYPAPIRRRLKLKFAEALLDNHVDDKDLQHDKKMAAARDKARNLINEVMADNPTQAESDAGKVLTGRILGVEGDIDGAQALWQQVADSQLSSLARAEAGYALILSKYGAGKMTRLDAIEALDRMRFDWRGDDFEVRLLRKMGELKYDDADYHGALDAFRQILTNFPDNPYIPEIAAEMQNDFTSVFVGPKADTVPPVAALAVFQEFKVLTPPGKLGDAVARNLIDRLVAIDLLDRAAGALYQEITTRLTGLAQARAGAELALLELLQGKPDEARKALALPFDPAFATPGLLMQRQEFAASAAFMSGDKDGAIKLLQGDSSLDADRLRTDIYWAKGDWKSVASLLVARLPPPGPNLVLDEQTAALAINAATAMSLSGDQAGLASLRQNYAAAMEATSLKQDFDTLVGAGVPNPSSLANFGSQVAGSRSFIETYRQKLTRGRLSEVLSG
jgi:tetratricopeptide (TPR) repeat protein